MSRSEFVQVGRSRVLRIDYRGMSLAETLAALQQSESVVAAEPLGSVRVLTLWDAPLTRAAADLIRRHVVVNTPFIRASAVVTPRPMQKVFFDSMKVGGKDRLKVFEDEAAALEWLADQ